MNLSARSAWTIALALGLATLFAVILIPHPAAAQAFRHPFAIGAQEGGVGRVSGITAWILGQESAFYLMLSHALDDAKHSGAALLGLLGVGFAYGVFHAAGPGHGKAVITSYMISNERAIRRGLVISALAALLQGLVAIVLIGCAALIFNATAQKMTAAAHVLELIAYSGIVLLGVALVWRKGKVLVATLRVMLAEAAPRWNLGGTALATEPAVLRVFADAPQTSALPPQRSTFRATEADALAQDDDCGPLCGHVLALDPKNLGDGFSWQSAALTVVTAGARPCSGAILVLVFSLAQGIFGIGIAAVIAMAFGTALTTAALALIAVFGKRLAVRIADNGRSRRARLVAQLIEVGAAVCVLAFGALLLVASWTGMLTAA
ncbi:MAG: nickel/cobalt transporter [Methylovirgula sp.]